jgi:hypothetical protein
MPRAEVLMASAESTAVVARANQSDACSGKGWPVSLAVSIAVRTRSKANSSRLAAAIACSTGVPRK